MCFLEGRNQSFFKLCNFFSVEIPLLVIRQKLKYLLDEKFTSPIAIIILTIFECLTPLLKPSNCGANPIMLMKPTTGTFFSKPMLVTKDPRFVMRVVCLRCHLIMSNKYQDTLNKIPL